MDTFYLIIFGALVHLVFFYSIFDIYFTSPLVHGMRTYRSSLTPPAKRLVLFVADGLRADKFFEVNDSGHSRAKYLRTIIEKHGAWGVSHTHVPTESRPGHVALIAGFYEDVSAVAKGWKENPVEFDSVFNESKYTWSWGSPDILPMFAKGATGSHVFTHCYHGDQEDFAGSDSSKLDTWVFDRVKEFLAEGKTNKTLQRMLNEDKIVFFLHLLGIDTNGHSHKPHSVEYLNNIRLMDAGIESIVSAIEDFYQDDKTAYIMSSDHGMTNWGSHGAGHPHETLTPLVAWGAGVRKPVQQSKNDDFTDGLSEDWKLNDIKRSDVEQADVAALMTSLIGIPYPLNSVGTLPVDYLDASDKEKAEHMFANALQILAQYQMKMEEKKSTTLTFVFRPYSELTPGKQVNITRHIQSLIQKKIYTESIKESQSLIKLALEGLHYYQKYDRFFLGFSITCGFLGWMTYVMTLIIEDHTGFSKSRVKLDDLHRPYLFTDRGIKMVFLSFAFIIIFMLFIQSLPWTNYLYCLIPVLLWMLVFLRFDMLVHLWQKIRTLRDFNSPIIAIVSCCFGLEILVTGFFRRELLSIGLISMAVWGVISYRKYCKVQKDKFTVLGWFVSCVLLAVFPLLPVVGRETNYNLVVFGGLATIYCGISTLRRLPSPKTATFSWEKYIYYIQICLVVAAIFIVKSTSISISNKKGLPHVNQIFSWIILGVSIFIPMLSSTKILHRLLSIALAFIPPYLLLSISQEALFVVCLCWLLHFWLKLENLIGGSEKQKKLDDMDFVNKTDISESPRYLLLEDIRRAFYYIFFILTGFFGTGNIASINSFEPASVYCFLTVFNPFVMGALMLLKNILPLILVSCSFHAIHIITSVPTKALFLLVLIMSDFMALNFFFLVRDYGSWLEIGTSISHYIIVMCMNIFLMMLFVVSQILTSFKFFNKKHHCN